MEKKLDCSKNCKTQSLTQLQTISYIFKVELTHLTYDEAQLPRAKSLCSCFSVKDIVITQRLSSTDSRELQEYKRGKIDLLQTPGFYSFTSQAPMSGDTLHCVLSYCCPAIGGYSWEHRSLDKGTMHSFLTCFAQVCESKDSFLPQCHSCLGLAVATVLCNYCGAQNVMNCNPAVKIAISFS